MGEIGLDFFRNLSSPDVQRAAFERQLGVAADRGLPVLVHDRDAHQEVTAALAGWPGRARGVLHAFSGDAAMAELLVARGFLVSFALPISFRSAVGPRAAAAAIGPETYLLETDAPYLGPDRDGRNEPTTVLRVATEVARLRGIEPQAVANAVRGAYERLGRRLIEPLVGERRWVGTPVAQGSVAVADAAARSHRRRRTQRMGQVNVNSGDGGGEPAGSSGAGFILGIIIAIIVIAVLVYVLVLAPGGNGGTDTDDGGGDVDAPAPSALMVTHRA